MDTIGFLGTGNMGSAILKGIAGSSLAPRVKLLAYNPDGAKVDALASYGVVKCHSEAETASACKYLFLAIKPQIFDAVLPKIADVITEETVLISIAAGIDTAYIRRLTKPFAKVVLAMPNTPLLLGEGATALARDDRVADGEFEVVRAIFDACGKTAVIPSAQMKEIIAINGSSPAFIYLFAKGFMDYAASVGISEETAKTLFAQSLIGSARMITDSGYSVETLIQQVSSPGGTTVAGLTQLEEGNLTGVIQNACAACTRRAYQLAK